MLASDEPAKIALVDLLPELLEHVATHVHGPEDLARLSGVSRLFRGRPEAPSCVETALRARCALIFSDEQGDICDLARGRPGVPLLALLRLACAARFAAACYPSASAGGMYGVAYSLRIDSGGSLFACGSTWGGSRYKEGLAVLGGAIDVPFPLLVPLPAATRVSSVSAGGSDFALLLTSKGTVLSWGVEGPALGHGDRAIRRLPTVVAGLADVRAVVISVGFLWRLRFAWRHRAQRFFRRRSFC
ncbi:hypothetical protein T492DRAFT_1090567 [Pavlovales sp. CCMP2436]|nr:hypothetical protein T492DRAFT_1090567 [Pavlovales sp. CCMP2436]